MTANLLLPRKQQLVGATAGVLAPAVPRRTAALAAGVPTGDLAPAIVARKPRLHARLAAALPEVDLAATAFAQRLGVGHFYFS